MEPGVRGVWLLQKSQDVEDTVRRLPEAWHAAAQRRYDNGEISGYQLQLELARANRMRYQANIVAYQLQHLGEDQALRLAQSSFAMAAFSLAFGMASDKIAMKLAANKVAANFTLPKMIAASVLRRVENVPTTTGDKIIETLADIFATETIGAHFSADKIDFDEHYREQLRTLEGMRDRIGKGAEDKLMAAYMLSVVQSLDKIHLEQPENYDAAVEAKAKHLDKFLTLTEENQAARKLAVKSPWKTTRDLQQWLDAQVIAKQREEQKAREKRLAGVTAAFSASPVQGKAPLRVRFDARGSKGEIERFVWDFGDKRGGQGMIVDHIYQSKGEFQASLTVHSAYGRKHTSSQTIAVTAKQAAVSVGLSVSPKEAKPGDRVQIQVNPQVAGLDSGQINVAVAVDGKRIGQKTHGGSLKGNLAYPFQYTVPAGLTGGDRVVEAVARVRATTDDKWIAAMTSGTFRVKDDAEKVTDPMEMFIGSWTGMMIIPTGDPEVGTLRAPVTIRISAEGESKIRVNTNSPHPATEPTSELYDVKGNSAKLIKHEFKDGMESHMTTKMTVVGEGGKRIIGSSTTVLFDPGPPREKVVDVSGSFFANRVK